MLRDIATAVRLLTIVPLGGVDGVHPARYFALVGWLFATIAVGIASGAVWLGRADGLSALLAAAVVVASWALLSGFLHWDGLADSADGLGVRGDAARRLEAMRGSTTGAFGVLAVVLVAALQIAAIAVIIESRAWWALGAAPIVGRWGAGMALSLRDPARADGLAARYAEREAGVGVAMLTLPVLPLLASAPDARGARVLALAGALLVAFVVPGPFAKRFGGITGDVLGATVLLGETAVLVGGALAGGLL
ncbi:MAG: adenosylcobinamide-GDP ribazoletransferase [Coriobacteriia bacterium]|nr:adenosylcobinamide-GDP ribazoletransferase [Coriobacteriia bacterium]